MSGGMVWLLPMMLFYLWVVSRILLPVWPGEQCVKSPCFLSLYLYDCSVFFSFGLVWRLVWRLI